LRSKKFVFDEKHFNSFDILKSKLTSSPVLAIYSPNAYTELHTDASSSGFGAILFQKQDFDLKMHPVMFFSRKTTSAESKLHSFELETLALVYSLKRFRNYLFGMRFVLVTDCQAVRFTLEKKEINPKIGRWSIYLEQYNFDIQHRKGERMQHVDALSRVEMFLVEDCFPVFDNILVVNQIRDKNVQKLKTQVESKKIKDYEIRDNVLYRKDKGRLLIYVPGNMIESIVHKYHDTLGHFGIDKTCELIRRSFYFANMRKVVSDHIRKCVMCITFNPPDGKNDGFLHVPEKPTVPFDIIHADHLGPLDTTKNKNQHILVVVDAFTKITKLYATKTTKTLEVVK
jgi:hypothetical protein